MRTKPFKTDEYFRLLVKILKEEGKWPESIIDYAVSATSPVEIRTYQCDLKMNLNYGASEGIYLDVDIQWHDDGGIPRAYELGTIKTLHTDDEAMHIMASLLADFVIENSRYINGHLDEFEWSGYSLAFFGNDGKPAGLGLSVSTIECARREAGKYMTSYGYAKVVIRDNATRKTTEIKK